jgi:limonene-1,2-epoxide hydrolase
MDHTKSATRREFLVRGGVGAAALLNGAALLEAGQQTDTERTNIKLVNDFCGAFATHEIDRIGSFLAENAVWRGDNGSFATGMPAVGRDAILARIKRFLDRIVEFKVVQSFATGTVVVNERFDRFMPERTLHLAGVFYVKDGKILEWTDFLAS